MAEEAAMCDVTGAEIVGPRCETVCAGLRYFGLTFGPGHVSLISDTPAAKDTCRRRGNASPAGDEILWNTASGFDYVHTIEALERTRSWGPTGPTSS